MDAMSDDLPFTGERFIPGVKGEIWVEHWHRYHFAARWVAGKRVLDVACGEGYGSALLARAAAHVTGVDIAQPAVDHARATYAAVANLRFERASCTELPLPDASIDVAVTFETVEHITGQERFLDELARVLKPDGVLILSCPNKLEYSDKRHFRNEYHVKELYRDELERLVSARFPESRWFGQRPTFFSVIAPEAGAAAAPAAGELFETSETSPSEYTPALSSPLYFLAVASRNRACLEAVSPALSVLADRDDWAYRDYAKVMQELRIHVARGDALEQQLAERERTLAQLQEEARGWRAWLRLPLVRLGLLK
jgi:SAM-dependent methyltransferase